MREAEAEAALAKDFLVGRAEVVSASRVVDNRSPCLYLARLVVLPQTIDRGRSALVARSRCHVPNTPKLQFARTPTPEA